MWLRGLAALVALVLVGHISSALWSDPAQAQSSGSPRILFINPSTPEDLHWGTVTEFMQAAASDLNVALEVQHAFHSGQYILKYATLAAESATPPDYIIFRNIDGIAAKVFAVTSQAGIKTITIDAPMLDTETAVVGTPRTTFPTWLGQVIPNAVTASEKMTQALVAEVNRRNFKGLIKVVAITGPENDVGSMVRLYGMRKALEAAPNAQLLHAFPANWDQRTGDRQAYEAFRYAAKSPIWWVANDNMALGVLNVLRNTNRKPGVDTFIGAFHWTEPMMTAILQNKIQYVAGGHFIQGGIALILAHDHFHGRDFSDVGPNFAIDMSFLYQKNLQSIGRIMISHAWDRIDFRRFSRAANPALANYDLSATNYLRAVLGQ